jgi:GntR family transcriptional regulator
MSYPAGQSSPLYVRVANRLRDEIETLQPGARLPGEPALVRSLGVSRVTLRKAIELLIDEELLIRRHGLGTFLAPPRLVDPLIGLHSMRDLVAAHSESYAVQIECHEIGRASPDERRRLALPPRAKVLRYQRRDLVGGEVICAARVTVLGAYAAQLDVAALRASSTYHLLETRCGVRPARIRQTVYAGLASESVASLLAVSAGRPILVLDRVTYTSDEIPVEWGLLSYRHDRIECSVELVPQVQSRQESARLFEVRYSAPRASQEPSGHTA